MARSKARAARRACTPPPAPRAETEAEKIARLRLLRQAGALGLLPKPDPETGRLAIAPAPAPKGAPVLRSRMAEDVGELPRLRLESVPAPERARAPAPGRHDEAAIKARDAFLSRNPGARLAVRGQKPVAASSRPRRPEGPQAMPAGIPDATKALLAAATARALTPAEIAALAASLNA